MQPALACLNFKTSSNLAAAYGIAVTGTMVITTILAYEVARQKWHWSLLKASSIFGAFLIMDVAFFAANARKVTHGGWVPLVIGAVIYLLMTTLAKRTSGFIPSFKRTLNAN